MKDFSSDNAKSWLYDYMVEHNKQIIDKTIRLAVILAALYAFFLGWHCLLYCSEHHSYQPLTIRAFLELRGDEWTQHGIAWVDNPQNGGLIGWLLKWVLSFPWPLMMGVYLYFLFGLSLAVVLWCTKQVAKYMGSVEGVIAGMAALVGFIVLFWYN